MQNPRINQPPKPAVEEDMKTRKLSVKPSSKDWSDLVNFVSGDLDNMAEGCEIKEQMSRILNSIRSVIIENENNNPR